MKARYRKGMADEKKTRKSRAQASADREQLEEIERLRKEMLERSERAIKLRSNDREFHGLNREFQYAQAELTRDYLKSKDVKHPRDVGTIREVLLRRFLSASGYLPRRYAVSTTSFRAVSTTGLLSNELDIALIDPFDSIRLMNREDVFEVFPIESVHGAIQVKSRLTETELASALKNIASFKRLQRNNVTSHGFGIIFCYETGMAWLDIVAKLEAFMAANPPTVWPNAVFILNVGFFAFGSSNSGHFLNSDIETIEQPQVHGRPDQGDLLYSMHSVLLELLRTSGTAPPPFDAYFSLPLVAEERSYRFSMGQFAEVGSCGKHGDFSRKIPPPELERLVEWCSTAPAINWIRANDLGMGHPGDNEAAYARQPGDVRIYNPDGLPLPDILYRQSLFDGREVKTIDYDIVEVGGMSIFVPRHYTEAEGIITGCPTCAKGRGQKGQ